LSTTSKQANKLVTKPPVGPTQGRANKLKEGHNLNKASQQAASREVTRQQAARQKADRQEAARQEATTQLTETTGEKNSGSNKGETGVDDSMETEDRLNSFYKNVDYLSKKFNALKDKLDKKYNPTNVKK
jgi:hypothetical protein